MRISTLAVGTALVMGMVAAPTMSYAGWASRVAGSTVSVPYDSQYRYPSKASQSTPYPSAAPTSNAPIEDPTYFHTASGAY